MVTTTPNKIIEFPESASSASTLESLRDKGREYLDATVTAAQENPWRAAAIGAGVVATVAATAYGASLIAQRVNSGDADADPEAYQTMAKDTINPESLPKAVPLA